MTKRDMMGVRGMAIHSFHQKNSPICRYVFLLSLVAVVSSVINISFPSMAGAGISPAFLIMFEGGEKIAKVEIRFDSERPYTAEVEINGEKVSTAFNLHLHISPTE